MQTSLNITYADSSLKKSTKSLTYVNPEATNAELEIAASLFSAISQNDYVGAERIDRMNVTEPDPTPATKPSATITSHGQVQNELVIGFIGEATTLTSSFNYTASGTATVGYSSACTVDGQNDGVIFFRPITGTSYENGSVTIYSQETTNYAATSTTITVTAQ
ncbi:MAG: hypothetical protein IKT98_04405 [Selenomonadaceae bacterium]|nr:hypothetical protein [Selenomonadaceae bacterium]